MLLFVFFALYRIVLCVRACVVFDRLRFSFCVSDTCFGGGALFLLCLIDVMHNCVFVVFTVVSVRRACSLFSCVCVVLMVCFCLRICS